jgi:succinyl-CoA synthetase beta subunit
MATRSDLKKKLSMLWGNNIYGEKFKEVLAAEKIDVKKEYYLSAAIDRFKRCPVLVFSKMGGMDIEEIQKKEPKNIFKVFVKKTGEFPEKELFKMLAKAKCPKKEIAAINDIAGKLYSMFTSEDCILAEINPLIVAKDGEFFAADAKVVIDDESFFRHGKWGEMPLRNYSGLEKEAHNFGLAYVELNGDLAIIGNGAGLVMSTLDMAAARGEKPANFCDVGGGASALMMEEALDIVLQKKSVRKLLINIFGGITRCDEIAEGLIDYLKRKKINVPIVVRLTGTNDTEAINILKGAGIEALKSFPL